MTVDKTLTCSDCGQEFTFTASEQDFYAERGFTEPRRCASCRASRKAHATPRRRLVRGRSSTAAAPRGGTAPAGAAATAPRAARARCSRPPARRAGRRPRSRSGHLGQARLLQRLLRPARA